LLRSDTFFKDAVKHQDFKTCDQAGFCKRNRAYADAATAHGAAWKSPYVLSSDSITFKDGKLEGTILKTIARDGTVVRLPLTIAFLASGTVRVTVDEERRQKGDIVLRHNSQARKERYNEAEKWALVGGLETSKDAVVKKDGGAGSTVVLFGPARAYEAVVRHAPFGIDFNRDGETHVRFNDRGFMNVEHWRPKIVKTPPPPEDGKDDKDKTDDKAGDDGEDESTWWEETFGGNTDSKPRGPESVALDISFPAYEHVIGIPEHAGPLSLKETR
jgi:alpha 1,3-glucosidase